MTAALPPATGPTPANRSPAALTSRIGGQSALLFSGFATSQAMSFARNALIGHWLSQGDFGIAATITLMLQLIELMSDVGADRLIIQAADGHDPELLSTCHAVLIARGIITSLALYLSAGPLTHLFAIPDAQWAFEAASLVPFIKGFLHLDIRRFQRRLFNRPFVLVDVIPQAAALALMLPALHFAPGYAAIVWVSLTQAAVTLACSHALAERAYRVSCNVNHLRRLITFGWPIWLSAFPLIAVYQGDRILVGSMLGIEALAAFTTAFMITMVPGLIAGKVGNALMLPLLSQVRDDAAEFANRYRLMVEAMVIASTGYLVLFIVAGGAVLPIAFGPNYTGLADVVTWLAIMWAMRMVQAVPGMALLAEGDTRPLLVAGLVRAIGLAFAALAAVYGLGLAGMAAAGAVSEFLSLLYVANRAARHRPGLAKALLVRCTALVPAATIAAVIAANTANFATPLLVIGLGLGLAAGLAGLCALAMPRTRHILTPLPVTQPA